MSRENTAADGIELSDDQLERLSNLTPALRQGLNMPRPGRAGRGKAPVCPGAGAGHGR